MKNPEMGDSSPEQAETKKHTIELKGGGSITVEETKQGIYKIVDDSITKKGGDPMVDATDIGFGEWDDSVQDRDNGYSDISQCFGMSEHLQWEEVEFTPYEIKAPSLDRLKEALQYIEITPYCPGDI